MFRKKFNRKRGRNRQDQKPRKRSSIIHTHNGIIKVDATSGRATWIR